MKQLWILYSALVVTYAQLPGFSFGTSGFGRFALSNPLFNASFAATNPIDRVSDIASRARSLANTVQQNLPKVPQLPNPLSAFSRFARPSGSSSSTNSNTNYNQNTNDNRVGQGVDSARKAINDVVSAIPRVSGLPRIPDIPEIPGLSNFGAPRDVFNSFVNSLNNITNGQGISNPEQMFSRINNFLPEVSSLVDKIANFAKSATNSGIWSNISNDIKNEIQSRVASLSQGFSNITSAIEKIGQNIPNLIQDQRLNTTLRNEPFFFPNRSVIVHLFEWKFDDIAEECEKVLGPNGYGGVQVSPINEYLVSSSRAWWERYQPISYEIKSRSGNEKQFSDMVKRCLKSGIRIYVDVVFNHMAAPGASSPLYGTAGSTCDPQDRDYPSVPFNQSHFHTACQISNYNNATNVRSCELGSLPDLDQSNHYVRQKIVRFLNHLLDLGVAGFRVDAAKHMLPADLKAIYDSLKSVNPMFLFPPGARPFIYQEVIDLGNEAVSAKEYTNLGVVTDFAWGLVIGDIFRGSLSADALQILTKNGSSGALLPSNQALIFVDNHDNQRGHGAGGASILNYKTKPQYIQAVAFTLATDYGIARVMSSYDFSNSDQGPPQDAVQIIKSPGSAANGSCTNGWVCEHRWPEIRRMIQFKNYVAGTSLDHIQATPNTFAFCRGEKGFVVLNNSENTITQVYHTCLPQGQYCDIISGELSQGACSGTVINVNENGDAEITLAKNSIVALYLPSKLP
ncbi:alpha-amylase I-like [Armigeres subalbatus]|uniref:alpha-amylase I-like n=1 Tax=Armigeres subalbatus TaxID=124917 RepID=UPI002ED4653F